MRRVRSRDTNVELRLRKGLFHKGLRYRINVGGLPGRPDIAFMKARVAVFVDGDFWHGHQWVARGLSCLEEQFHINDSYWVPKIRRTIERDAANTARLEALGWVVIRVWESEVAADIHACLSRVLLELQNAEQGKPADRARND